QPLPYGGSELRDPEIKGLDARRVSLGIVPMTVLRVEVHQVGDHQHGPASAQVADREVHTMVVRVRIGVLRQAMADEDIPDLADPVDGDAGFLRKVEERGAWWRDGEVAAFWPSRESARLAAEGPSDHPTYLVIANQDAPGDPAPFVQGVQGD